MKKTIYFLTATLFASGSIIIGCKPSVEKVENAEEKVSEAKHDLSESQMDYSEAIQNLRVETDAKIAANEKRINELKAKVENEKIEARAARKEKIAELELKNKEMKKRMDEYNDNGKEGWESFKREFNHDMDELGNALDNLTVNNKK